MPRIRIVHLEDGRYQVAVLPNRFSEGVALMATVAGKKEAKVAIKTLNTEAVAARPARFPGLD